MRVVLSARRRPAERGRGQVCSPAQPGQGRVPRGRAPWLRECLRDNGKMRSPAQPGQGGVPRGCARVVLGPTMSGLPSVWGLRSS